MIRRCALALVIAVAFAVPTAVTPQAAAETATAILTSGPAANRVDIAIVGDGYTLAELPKYHQDVARITSGLFAQQPFKEYKRYFNVTQVDVVSAGSGADHPERSRFVDTAFDATYNCANIQRLICANNTKVQAALARSLPPEAYDLALVVVNDPEYGGSGGGLSVVSAHPDVVELALHELGHSFGQLADEYGGASAGCGSSEPWQVNATAESDRDLVEWRNWIAPTTSVPTSSTAPGVPGLYEGAAYCDAGLYRPTADSKMRSLGRGFDPVNTEQIVRRIYSYVSPIDTAAPDISTLPFVAGSTTTLSVGPMRPATHVLDVRWRVDGEVVGSEQTLPLDVSTLTGGAHEVAVRVRDRSPMVRSDDDGLLVEEASWSINVDGSAPRTFVAAEDAFVARSKPWTKFGRKSALRARGGRKPVRSYIKFDVRGLRAPAKSAKLRLAVTGASVSGGDLRIATATSWKESRIRYKRAPGVPASIASSVGAVAEGSIVEFDLGDAITSNGLYTFVLTSASRDQVSYSSSEGTAPPQLVVTP